MKKNSEFSQRLLCWYQKNKRWLPWRETKDPYKIWISEVMLQQTTVKAVIPYFHRWIKKFPTIEAVAKSSEQEILNSWQGLGYYNRAKNIKKSSAIICELFSGNIPEKYDELKKLPGFGPYTTGALLSIAFDQRIPIIDANVRRVIMRILVSRGYAETTQDHKIYKFLRNVLPYKNMGDFNQSLMELGALICQSKNPQCLLCPVRIYCLGYKEGKQEIIPKLKKKTIQSIDAVVAIIKKGNKYFIQKRPSTGLLADLWEFPGGKIEQKEKPVEALRREITEELNSKILKTDYLFSVQHFYTQFRVKLHVFQCSLSRYPKENIRRKWVALKQLKNYPFPSGSVKIIEKIHSKKIKNL